MNRSAEGRSSGFTLVEILVVVVILGIAGALIVPQLGRRSDLEAAAAARVMMADLTYAQNRAVSRQKTQFVRFNTTDQTWQLLEGAELTAVEHPVNKTTYLQRMGPSGTVGLRRAALAGVTLAGQPTPSLVLGFDELGTPLIRRDDGTTEQLTLGRVRVQSGDYTLEVSIEPYTGSLSVAQVD